MPYIDVDLLKESVLGWNPPLDSEQLKHMIDTIPLADVVKVKHGEWKVKRDDYDTQFIKCSVCKEEFYSPDNCFDFDFVPNYCMNCGAKMEDAEC